MYVVGWSSDVEVVHTLETRADSKIDRNFAVGEQFEVGQVDDIKKTMTVVHSDLIFESFTNGFHCLYQKVQC